MELSAKKRDLLRKKTKILRKEGSLPAVLFSSDSSRGDKEVLNLTLNTEEFKKVYKTAGTSALVKLSVDEGKNTNILISDVQVDPITLSPIHVSLFEVDMKEEIETDIPVNVINNDEHDLVKSGEGIIIVLQTTIPVKCLPANLPAEFVVDAAQLKAVGDVIKVSDINVDRTKVQILLEAEDPIVKLDFAQQLETEEQGPTSVDDVEITTAKREDAEGEEAEAKDAE